MIRVIRLVILAQSSQFYLALIASVAVTRRHIVGLKMATPNGGKIVIRVVEDVAMEIGEDVGLVMLLLTMKNEVKLMPMYLLLLFQVVKLV